MILQRKIALVLDDSSSIVIGNKLLVNEKNGPRPKIDLIGEQHR